MAPHAKPNPRRREPIATPPPTTPQDHAYWLKRLVERPYSGAARLKPGRELSVHLRHDESSGFFPLGTAEPHAAAARAAALQRDLASNGWAWVCHRNPREIAVAIFWLWSPLATTYTTLQTLPPEQTWPRPSKPQRSARRILLIEPDPSLRLALAHWLGRNPDFACIDHVGTVEDAIALPDPSAIQLVLVDRKLVEATGDTHIHTLERTFPQRPVCFLAAFEDSNYIFHSVSGVDAGYVLRRRPPQLILEPIARWTGHGPGSRDAFVRECRRYFQSLLTLTNPADPHPGLSILTGREHQTLEFLSRGCTDKEIAESLGISVWTVHGHVKNVFEKLGVHSRTEAVVRFLQH